MGKWDKRLIDFWKGFFYSPLSSIPGLSFTLIPIQLKWFRLFPSAYEYLPHECLEYVYLFDHATQSIRKGRRNIFCCQHAPYEWNMWEPGGFWKEKIKLSEGKKKEILKIVWNESKIEKQLEKFTKFNFVNDENLWEN